MAELPSLDRPCDGLAFAANGRLLAGAYYGGVRVWDVDGRHDVAELCLPGVPLRHVSVSGDGQYLAASGFGPSIWVWHLAKQERPTVIHTDGSVVSLAMAPVGHALAAVTRSGHLVLWRLPKTKS
jgi:WD40 repeat protein